MALIISGFGDAGAAPPERAGLKRGDVIEAFNGQPVPRHQHAAKPGGGYPRRDRPPT